MINGTITAKDNILVFIYKFITDAGTFYFADGDSDISIVESNAINYDDYPVLSSASGNVNSGGYSHSSNISLRFIQNSDSSLTSSFFNSFYPNSTGINILGAKVECYIVASDSSDINDLILIATFTVLGYSYDDSIQIDLEHLYNYQQTTIPVHTIQNTLDNKIGFTINFTDSMLGSVVPIIYGSFAPVNNDFDYPIMVSTTDTALFNSSTKSSIISAHRLMDSGIAYVGYYNRNINRNVRLDSFVLTDYIGSKTTSINTDTNTVKCNFVLDDEANALFSTIFMFPYGVNTLLKFDDEKGLVTPFKLTTTGSIATFRMPINLTDTEIGSFGYVTKMYVHVKYKIDTDGDRFKITIKDVRDKTASPTTIDEVHSSSVLPKGIYTDSFQLFNTGVTMDKCSWDMPLGDIVSASTSAFRASIKDLELLVSEYGTNVSSILLYNIAIEIKYLYTDGTYFNYIKDGVQWEIRDTSANNTYYGDSNAIKHNLYKASGSISNIIASADGRGFAYFTESVYPFDKLSWINADSRSCGYSPGDLIENPAYICESILRDELSVLKDLQISNKYPVNAFDSPGYFYIDDLPIQDDDFYVGAYMYIGNGEYILRIDGYEDYSSITGITGKGLYISGRGGSLVFNINDIVQITNINIKIDTASFDLIGNTTDGTLLDWKLRRGISTSISAADLLTSLCKETFMYLIDNSKGFTLVDMFDTSNVVGTLNQPFIINGVEAISLQITPSSSIYNKFDISYKYTSGTNKYLKHILVDKNINNKCLYSEQTFKISRELVLTLNWHHDTITVLAFIMKLIAWHSTPRTLITYIGDTRTHIKYEIGDKVKIDNINRVPNSLNNSQVFMIVGKEINTKPVPSVKFVLIDIPEIVNEIYPPTVEDIDTWYRADVNIEENSTYNNVSWTDSIFPTSTREIHTGSGDGGTLYDVNGLTVLEAGTTTNTILTNTDGWTNYNPLQNKRVFTFIHVVKPKSTVTSVWCGGVWDITGDYDFWGFRWGFDANGYFTVNTKHLVGGTSYTGTGTTAVAVNDIAILVVQYNEASKTFTIIFNGEKVVLNLTTWALSGGYPQNSIKFNTYYGTYVYAIDTLDFINYDRIITDIEINGIGNYLASRWGTTWTNI